MKRFINADIIPGKLSNAVTLNRFAYANGNPVSFVDPFGLWSLKGAWNNFTNWVSDTANDVKDWAIDTYNNIKESAANTYGKVKDYISDAYNNAKEKATNTYNDVKENTINTYNNIKINTINSCNQIKTSILNKYTDIKSRTTNFFNGAVHAIGELCTVTKDITNIVINNFEASAGIGFGMGLDYSDGTLGIEAITRVDMIGIQIKNGKIRIGDPGRSAINVTIPSEHPAFDITIGPQNNTYENFDGTCREINDISYVDIGKSYSAAQAYVIAYHYDVSISYSGILTDTIEYFRDRY